MANDHAIEWLANEVQAPILETIRRTLQTYLAQVEKDDVMAHEAEAAAALLLDLSSDCARMRYTDLNCRWLAKKDDVSHLAIQVLKKMLQDTRWISEFSEPQQKTADLQRLLSDLQRIQTAVEDKKQA